MKPKTWRWFSLWVVLSLLLSATSMVAASPQPPQGSRTTTASSQAPEGLTAIADAVSINGVFNEIPGATDPALYIVRLKDPALASYFGGIPGLAATSPRATGAAKLDPQAPASVAYLDYLKVQHAQALTAVEQTVGRSVEMTFQYLAVLNGFAITLTPQEAVKVAALPAVAAVSRDVERELDTDVGPLHIGAPAIWNGETGTGLATRGEGVIIGVIDTGINSQHPSFAATDGDGYTHTNPYGAGVYKGWCVANPSFCNAKLIGAYTFHPNGGSPEDTNGHGSHTASTAGGNAHIATFNVGADTYNLPIQGVAPRANIVAYKVCDPTCPDTASVAAVNSAILNDQVDVLNYSISGGDFPWNDNVDLAFLDAYNAGIFVSASAGNSGPGPSTVAKTGPWNASVAASTHNRAIVQTLDVTAPGTPAELQGLAVVPGEGTTIATDINSGIRYDATNNTGCTPFTPGFFTGNLALIQRGGCTFADKVANAVAAGATGVVLFQSVGGPPISAGGLTGTPPVVMLDLASGVALRDYVVANPATTSVRINAATSLIYVDAWEDIVAGFSSRGPSQYELLKPDYIAPGVNILAAVQAQGSNVTQYGFLQGTSMSSPHGAGAAALMVALHPTWSPAEIKSAMASTAAGGLLKEDGLTPADPFDVGSGLLDLSLASTTGLVFDETYANYVAANPALGGDPKTLNQPSMVNYNCMDTCTWTRTVKSVLTEAATYNASFTGPAGMLVTVTPSTFTIPAGGTQVLTITADVTALTPGDYAFGSVQLETDAVWPAGRSAAAAVLLNESFTDTTFPPTGWASYKLAGSGTATWIRDTAQSNSAPASARRLFGGSADGDQDDWLVTPPLALESNGTLRYYDRGQWMPDYGYSGVWISTESCDPADGDFVELLETPDIPNVAWRATPVTVDLSAYADETVCLAFRYGGDFAHTWWIDDVVVESFPADVVFVSDIHMPVVVVPTLSVPLITVDPAALSATQAPGIQTMQTLTIGNDGGVNLEWEFSGDTIPTTIVLWEQLVNGGSGIVSDFFIGSNAGAYSASDFVLSEATDISYIFTPGFDNTNTLSAQPAINWAIYANNAGVPAGHPEDGTGMASALWAYTSAVNGPGVDITNNDIALDLVAAGQTLSLTPGTYWLTVYPSYNVTGAGGARWNWYQAAQVGAQTHLVSPGIFGVANWTSLSALGVTFTDTAFRLETAGEIDCDHPDDVSWLTVVPTMGTTAPDGATPVDVTFDSTGMAAGVYEALLCVESNDPETPVVEVPVTLTVEEAPEIGVAPAALSSVQPQGTVETEILTISNTGIADLEWEIEEAPALPVRAATVLDWSEGFDDVTLLPGLGWAAVNNSSPVGTTGWFQGNSDVFPAHSGAANAYIGANFNNTAGAGTISNWLLTPEITLNNGDVFSFWTRRTGSEWQDRLQVRMSTAGGSANVGATATSVGDFTTLLLDINPTYGNEYPAVWTEYVITISDLTGPTAGRLAFRYFVENGGPSGDNSDYIGIDTVTYTVVEPNPCDSPADIPWLSVAPASGVTAPAGSDNVTVTFDATDLTEGEYTGNLCVFSNDPVTPLVVVPVALTVTEPTSVTLTALGAGSPALWGGIALLGFFTLGGVVYRRKRR